jgi:hypothetical protein
MTNLTILTEFLLIDRNNKEGEMTSPKVRGYLQHIFLTNDQYPEYITFMF